MGTRRAFFVEKFALPRSPDDFSGGSPVPARLGVYCNLMPAKYGFNMGTWPE